MGAWGRHRNVLHFTSDIGLGKVDVCLRQCWEVHGRVGQDLGLSLMLAVPTHLITWRGEVPP